MLGLLTEEETRSQPEVWRTVVDRLEAEAQALAPRVRRAQRILLLGCGSSHCNGLAAKEFLRGSGLASEVMQSSEYILRPPAGYTSETDVVAIAFSRSGHTSETCQALDEARRRHGRATLVAVTCELGSALGQRADIAIVVPEAQEQAIPQTRSVSAFWLFSLLLSAAVRGHSMRAEILALAERITSQEERLWQKLADQVQGYRRFMVLGVGIGHVLAQEAALKLTEMAHVDCWGCQTLEFRHSALEVIDTSTLLIGPLGPDVTTAEEDAVAEAAGFAGGHLDLRTLLGDAVGRASVLGQLYMLHAIALMASRATGRNADRTDRLQRFVGAVQLPVEASSLAA